jgi:hypothetical protein
MNETQEIVENKQPQNKIFDNFSQVKVSEATGTFFLGILSIMLFFAWKQSQQRYEKLLEQISLKENI